MKKKISDKLLLATGILGFLFILTITLNHRQPPLFDEVYFVKNFELFEKHGLSKEFLVKMDNQAPGPLYELVHFAFKPLTGLTTPGIRLVNVFLLGLTILLLARIIGIYRNISFAQSLPFAVALMAVPMVWQVTGLALTEMPTMFFSVLSFLFLLMAAASEHHALKNILLAFLAGLALGLSILGRSPFLTLGFASATLLLYDYKNPQRWRTLLIFGITALGVAIPVFLAWDGLVPPQQAFVGQGFSIWHGILAYAYGALLTLFIAPRWFYINGTVVFYLVACYILFLLTNLFLIHYEYAPLDRTLAKIFPPPFMKLYPMMISPLIATLSVYFVVCSLRQAWIRRTDTVFLFFLLAGMLILASSFKVTHLFSTRYVAQAAPFFVLAFPGFDQPTVSRLIRFLAAMAIGFFSLETYFHLM